MRPNPSDRNASKCAPCSMAFVHGLLVGENLINCVYFPNTINQPSKLKAQILEKNMK